MAATYHLGAGRDCPDCHPSDHDVPFAQAFPEIGLDEVGTPPLFEVTA